MKKIVLYTLVALMLVSSVFSLDEFYRFETQVANSSGSSLSGSQNFSFKVFDAETEGNQVFETNQTISNTSNVFLFDLNNTNIWWLDDIYYLEIMINDEVLSRERISGVPFSTYAGESNNSRMFGNQSPSYYLDDTDTDTTVAINLSEFKNSTGVVTTNHSVIQRRVATDCGGTGAIRTIGSDGVAGCNNFDDYNNWGLEINGALSDAITTSERLDFANGTGLGLTFTSDETITYSLLNSFRLPQSCDNGSFAKYNTSSGGWDCGIASYYSDSDIDGTESAFDGWDKDASDDVSVGDDQIVTLAGENITSGTVADARIASTIARDNEIVSTANSSGLLINWSGSGSQLTEDQVEAMVFDSDNTDNLNLSNYNITGVLQLDVTKICLNTDCTHWLNDTCHGFPSGGLICSID